MYPAGGYKTITPTQIANALGALDLGAIGGRTLRVYLACFELRAEREAAARATRASHKRARGGANYRVGEIARLLGDATEANVRAELRRLSRAGLLEFSTTDIAITDAPADSSRELLEAIACGRSTSRPVPVPRRVIVYLCATRKIALLKTALAYFVRGLSLDRRTGAVRAVGTAKVSWITRAFGLSERAVRAARAELIGLGLISRDTGSHQRKLNRDGAYFRIDLEWHAPTRPGSGAVGAVDNSHPTDAEIAPPSSKPPVEIAPPERRLETPAELKNQKLAAGERAGACERSSRPVLRNIRPENLRRLQPLRELFRQAVAARWLPPGEASFLNFAAAAVRANRADGDPVRIFVALVKGRLWHHISQADEDRARAVIRCGNSATRPERCQFALLKSLGLAASSMAR